MEKKEYIPIKEYAMRDGTWLGIIWILCFASFISQLSNPSMSFIWLAMSIFSLGFAFIRVKKFGRLICSDGLSFGRAWLYAITMFVCASLLMAIGAYVYFAFLDNGFVADTYTHIFESDEYKELLKVYQADEKMWKEIVGSLYGMRPIEWTFNILSTNIMLGMILSPLVAIYAKNKL